MSMQDHEVATSIGHIKDIGRVTWDSFGQVLVLELVVGPKDGPSTKLLFSMDESAAAELEISIRAVFDLGPEVVVTRQ